MIKRKHNQKEACDNTNSKASKKTNNVTGKNSEKRFTKKSAAVEKTTESKVAKAVKNSLTGSSSTLPFDNCINPVFNSVSIKFDKFVAIIRHMDEGVQNECIQNIQQIAHKIKKHHSLTYSLLRKQGGYKYSIKLPLLNSIAWDKSLHGVPHLYVQIAPFSKRRPFIKFELKGFSPTRSHYYATQLWLQKIIGSRALLFLNSNIIKITSLDIAMDFPIDITQIAVNLKHAHRSGVYLDLNTSGRAGSYYVGNKKSKLRLSIYDRGANCKAKNLPHSGEPKTRIEIQLKPNCFLNQLSSNILEGRFLERIEVYDLNKISALDDIHPHTLSVINMFGLKAAFQSLPKPDRRRYRKAFESCRIDLIPNKLVLSQTDKMLKKAMTLVLDRFDRDYNHSAAKKVRKYFKKNYS